MSADSYSDKSTALFIDQSSPDKNALLQKLS